MKIFNILGTFFSASFLFFISVNNAFAGTVPAPVIGLTGPYGIGIAVVGYGGYRAYKYIKSKKGK